MNTIGLYILRKIAGGSANNQSVIEVVKGAHNSNHIDATWVCSLRISIKKNSGEQITVCQWNIMAKTVKVAGVGIPSLDLSKVTLPTLEKNCNPISSP